MGGEVAVKATAKASGNVIGTSESTESTDNDTAVLMISVGARTDQEHGQGGEMDPHGANLHGNPFGGLVLQCTGSRRGGLSSSGTSGNQFCLIPCDPSDSDSDTAAPTTSPQTFRTAYLYPAKPIDPLSAINTMPHTARLPATKKCVTFANVKIYSVLTEVTAYSAYELYYWSFESENDIRTTESLEGTSNDAMTLMFSGVSLLGLVFGVVPFVID
ncbi:hypothetical protein BDQ17DRAFT_1425046 [Cyathus striatus]|nr:hypothetical protein BDQ17DRAFT_1425046 [Cyathus striatus]